MNIYVGNLNWGLEEDQIRDVFAEYGEVVSVKLIKDRETGRSKGFAFVEMADEEEGQNAIDQLDGREMDGRSLRVNKAVPREQRPRQNNFRNDRGGDRGRGGYGGGGGGGYRDGGYRDRGDRRDRY